MKPETLAKHVRTAKPIVASTPKLKRRHKRTVIKIKIDALSRDPCYSAFGVVCHFSPNTIVPLGRCALSVKMRKKRRLITGKMDSFPETDQCPHGGIKLTYICVFTPSNPDIIDSLGIR